jgi:putative PEP-CTERM system histidine kinase
LFYKKVSLIGESLLPGLWLLFSLTFRRKGYNEITNFWKSALFISILPFIFAVTLPINYFLYLPEVEKEKILFLNKTGYHFYLFILIYSILTLVNLEGTLRASSGRIRWQIKHMLIGVGGIMASMVYYYSQCILYRSIDVSLVPVRGSAVIISSIFIIVSIFRQTFPKEEIFVSRGIFYKSFILLVVGVYLIGLGIAGIGMRYLGKNFSKHLFIGTVFACTLSLISALFSETLRRKVKVFIDKNFYKDKYDYRTQWLQFTQRISSAHSFRELLSEILDGFASPMGSKTKSLWLKKDNSDIFYQAYPHDDFDEITLNGNSNLISYLREKNWIFNKRDGDIRVLEENRYFFEKTGASLVTPLISDGNMIGFVVLGESLSGNTYDYEDYDLLKTLSRQATSAIMNFRLAEELAKSREMEAVGRISSMVIHDLKNLASTLSISIENAIDNINNTDFQKDMLKSLSNTLNKMNYLIKKLSDIPKKIEFKFENVDLVQLVKDSTEPFLNGKVEINMESPESLRCKVDKEEIKKVIMNILLNAIEAPNCNKIRIIVGKENNNAFITVSDNGDGISEEYIEKNLFKPFKTTKKKGLGIGLYQCKSIVEAHGGDIMVKSSKGCGTDLTVYIPLVTSVQNNTSVS